MTTHSTKAPWADQPYTLLSTAKLNKVCDTAQIPRLSRAQTIRKNGHAAQRCAIDMIHAHNAMLRGLNAIVLQAPSIADATRKKEYNAEDVADLLFYVEV